MVTQNIYMKLKKLAEVLPKIIKILKNFEIFQYLLKVFLLTTLKLAVMENVLNKSSKRYSLKKESF